MILNKTNNLRQAIEKILFVLMVLVIVLLIIFFSIITICFFKEEFEKQIRDNEIEEVANFNKRNLVNHILENELLIFSDSKE